MVTKRGLRFFWLWKFKIYFLSISYNDFYLSLSERVEFLTKFQKRKQTFKNYVFSFQNMA